MPNSASPANLTRRNVGQAVLEAVALFMGADTLWVAGSPFIALSLTYYVFFLCFSRNATHECFREYLWNGSGELSPDPGEVQLQPDLRVHVGRPQVQHWKLGEWTLCQVCYIGHIKVGHQRWNVSSRMLTDVKQCWACLVPRLSEKLCGHSQVAWKPGVPVQTMLYWKSCQRDPYTSPQQVEWGPGY